MTNAQFRGANAQFHASGPTHRQDAEALLTDATEALRMGLLEPKELSSVQQIAGQLSSLRRGQGSASASRLESTAEAIRELISGRTSQSTHHSGLDSEFVALAGAMQFRRALLSTVVNNSWRPECLHIEEGLTAEHFALRGYLEHRTIALSDAPLELQSIRMRTASLVRSPRTHELTFKPLMTVSNSHGYAVAPLFEGRRLVGLVHADCFDEPATEADLARVTFSSRMLGVLAHRLIHRRKLADLADRLNKMARYTEEVAAGHADVGVPGSRSSAESSNVLTKRQSAILAEIARGSTNAHIAISFGLTEATVKTHVKKIFGRLGVHSRAAAAAAYYSGLP